MLHIPNEPLNLIKAHKTVAISVGIVVLIGATALAAPALMTTSKPTAHKTVATTLAASTTPNPTATPAPTSTPTPASTPAPAVKPVVTHIAPVAVVAAKATTPVTAPVVVSGQTLQPTQGQQVVDWFNQYGGYLTSLGNDFNNFSADVNTYTAADPATADPTAVIADCNQIAADATVGLNQPPIPDATIQADNVAWLTDMRSGAQDIAAGLTNRNSVQEQQGINEMTQADTELNTMATDLSNL